MGIVFTYYERFLWSALATFGCIFAPFVGGIAYALFKAAFPIQTRKMGKVLCTGKPAKPSSKKLEVAELRRELADRKLSTKGKKKALVKRLDAAITEETPDESVEQKAEKEEAAEKIFLAGVATSSFKSRFMPALRIGGSRAAGYAMMVILFTHPALSGQACKVTCTIPEPQPFARCIQ